MPSVLIVGAGVFGASTAYHLAKELPDVQITVLDRTPTPPAPAASTDINKIIRADYTNRLYVDLAYEAMEAWQNWPELKDCYHRTGWVMLDEKGSDVAENIRKIFRERGHDPTSDVPLAEIESRWGGILKGINTAGFQDAYWNPEAGWCEASRATAALMNFAIEKGVKYVCGQVEHLVLNERGVKGVKTADGTLCTADKIVLATGAWTSSLLSTTEDQLDIADENRVEKQVTAAGVAVAHFRMSSVEMDVLASNMPVVVYGENGEAIPPPTENNLLKFTNSRTFTNTVTTKSGHRISVPVDRDQHIVPKKLQQETYEYMIDNVMPMFTKGKPVDYWRLCWDGRTPTQDWLLDKHPHPRLSNLYLAVGGSFHSYKFLPTAGKYMVNVLSGVGNGDLKDKAWGWKSGGVRGRGAHEATEPKRDLSELEDNLAKL